MAVHVRFAPSPTGRLHPGNARTALVNWQFAKASDGRFTLRIDDTDPSREVAGAVALLRDDLAWLGIRPDAEVRQSARAERHRAAAADLARAGSCYEDAGSLRLRLGAATVRWEDGVHGPMRLELSRTPDPVLVRADGVPTYLLASVVDDLDLAVTHVIRGDDHLANTAVHLRLIEALGGRPPVFAHLPLVVDAAGAPLSKRDAAVSLAHLRDAGVEPEPLAAYLLSLGTGRAPSLAEAPMSLDGYGTAPPTFDLRELASVQDRWLQALDVRAVNARLQARGLDPVSTALWGAVRGNLGTADHDALAALPRLDRLAAWQAVVDRPFAGPIAPADKADLATAAALLARHPDDPSAWLEAAAAATGRRGRKLLLPLRLALTGRPDGPPVADLVALIGASRAARRLLGEPA